MQRARGEQAGDLAQVLLAQDFRVTEQGESEVTGR
jgi:hypothetical protein